MMSVPGRERRASGPIMLRPKPQLGRRRRDEDTVRSRTSTSPRQLLEFLGPTPVLITVRPNVLFGYVVAIMAVVIAHAQA